MILCDNKERMSGNESPFSVGFSNIIPDRRDRWYFTLGRNKKALHILLSIHILSPDYHTFITMYYKSTSNTAETKKKILSIIYLRCLSKIGHLHRKSLE
jgi:hypothetical protein